jgi:hypothetical protein
VNAIDTLGFNSHFLVEPFLPSAHSAQNSLLLLELSCLYHLLRLDVWGRLICWGYLAFKLITLSLGVVVILDIVRMPQIGLVAMDEVRHCSEIEDKILRIRIFREDRTTDDHLDVRRTYLCTPPLIRCLLEDKLEHGASTNHPSHMVKGHGRFVPPDNDDL